MSYTREVIIQCVDNGLASKENVSKLYSKPCIDYKGVTSDTKEKYTEVIAEHLLKNLERLNGINMISRLKSYNANHEQKDVNPASPRCEEQLARSIKGRSYDHIGEIIDYQTPLKNEQADDAGKIDLLAWNKDLAQAYILEFKAPKSPETLLRCVLEAHTYYKTAKHDKLLNNFGLAKTTTLRKAVLIYENSQAHLDYKGVHIKKLMKADRKSVV